MAYTKLPLMRGDCGIGYQTFNTLRDNLEEIRDDYTVEHSSGETTSGPLRPTIPGGTGTLGGTVEYGRHNSPGIAKAVANIGFTGALGASGPPSITYASNGYIVSVTESDTGVYAIATAGLAGIRGTAQALSDDAGRIFLAQAVFPLATSTTNTNLFLVYMYEKLTSLDAVSGIPFSVTIYGTPA